MKPGTIIRFADGREGTVVYNGLDGEGIAWGVHVLSSEFESQASQAWARENFGHGESNSTDFPDVPICEALLREPFTNSDIPCVGVDYEIISVPENSR